METQENCISETRKDRQRPQLSCGGPTSGLGAQLLLHCSNLGLRSHGQNLTLGRLPLVSIVFQGHEAMKYSEVFLIHPNHYWTILSWLVRSIHPNNLKVNLDHHPKSVGKMIEITSQVCFAFPPVDDHEITRFRMVSFHVVLPKINASICTSNHSFIHYRNTVDASETNLVICHFHPSIFLCCPPTCKLYQINSGWWFQPIWKILVNGKDYPVYYGKNNPNVPNHQPVIHHYSHRSPIFSAPPAASWAPRTPLSSPAPVSWAWPTKTRRNRRQSYAAGHEIQLMYGVNQKQKLIQESRCLAPVPKPDFIQYHRINYSNSKN